MTPEEKVAMLKKAGVWDVIGFPSCIDKLFDLVATHEREKLQTENEKIQEAWETIRSVVETYRKERNNDLSKMV